MKKFLNYVDLFLVGIWIVLAVSNVILKNYNEAMLEGLLSICWLEIYSLKNEQHPSLHVGMNRPREYFIKSGLNAKDIDQLVQDIRSGKVDVNESEEC